MKKILLLSGTSEGPPLAKALVETGFRVLTTVTRPEACVNLFGSLQGTIEVQTRGFTEETLEAFLMSGEVHLVLDATHPFAVRITTLARTVCEKIGFPYVRYERPDLPITGPDIHPVHSYAEAAKLLPALGTRAMLTIGSKQLKHFAGLHGRMSLFARILPSLVSLQQAFDAGFTRDKVMCLRPPFSAELNQALLREYRVEVLVTKASGEEGGVTEKIEAARALSLATILIRRPSQETGTIHDLPGALRKCVELLGGEVSPIPKPSLRSGFTTGACATAAAKGALLALVTQRRYVDSTIHLPRGKQATFPLHACEFSEVEAKACVIKDAGDDPDVTDKAEIWVRIEWSQTPGIHFVRGVGVGLVTKPGLPVPVGEPAINPVPRQMIVQTLQEILDDAGVSHPGMTVEISVPQGEAMAKKTFNPRLGIVGGISILGTTGIVVPYSTSAWVASVLQAIDVAKAQDCRHLVLTVGNRGERTAQELFPLPEVAFIQMGPFFGEALKHCRKAGIERIGLVAMIGKLAKFAAGNDSVHSTASRQDFDFLAGLARQAGASEEGIRKILNANTAQEVSDFMETNGLNRFFMLLVEQAHAFARSLIGEGVVLDVVLPDFQGKVLAQVSTRPT